MNWSQNFKSKEDHAREALRSSITEHEKKAKEAEEALLDPAFILYGSLQDTKRIKEEHYKATRELLKLKRKLAEMEDNLK